MVYKNIFYSFYHTYKMLFIGGWSRVAYFQQQTTNQIFVILFDICFLYLISYIYMNILYGTMMAN
jgi:NADH:ubiquinone oxidoreductase subunit H